MPIRDPQSSAGGNVSSRQGLQRRQWSATTECISELVRLGATRDVDMDCTRRHIDDDGHLFADRFGPEHEQAPLVDHDRCARRLRGARLWGRDLGRFAKAGSHLAGARIHRDRDPLVEHRNEGLRTLFLDLLLGLLARRFGNHRLNRPNDRGPYALLVDRHIADRLELNRGLPARRELHRHEFRIRRVRDIDRAPDRRGDLELDVLLHREVRFGLLLLLVEPFPTVSR